MLRDVVIHIHNEQPVLADLIHEPGPTDVALICRNLRTMAGKKPVFVDRADSTFVLPLAHIRFIEMPRASMEAFEAEQSGIAPEATAPAEPEGAGDPIPGLARLTSGDVAPEPEVEAAAAEPVSSVSGNPDELDDDLLRRIREA